MAIEKGKTVKINYTGKFEDGKVFDSSKGREPLKYKVGEGQIIKGLEQALNGMKVGDKKTIKVKAAEAYGEFYKELIKEIPKQVFGEQTDKLTVGSMIQLTPKQGGHPVVAKIAEIKENSVMVDMNHPLAGKDLYFDIEVVSVE